MLELIYLNRFDNLVRIRRRDEKATKISPVRAADGFAAIAEAKRRKLIAKRIAKT